MCYSFTDKMMEEPYPVVGGQQEAPIQPTSEGSTNNKEVQGRNGKKRSASEHPEQKTSKAAKLTVGNDDETYSESEVKEESDEKDELISKLTASLQNAKAKILELGVELDRVEDECLEYQTRVHVLEAREAKRLEKESVVETSMTAAMKLAAKKLDTHQKAEHQKRDKELRATYKDKLSAGLEKNDEKWEKKLADFQAKYQKAVADHKRDTKALKDDHKEEVRDLKEDHKEEIKKYKPDHSKAMKEKTNELKAKDQKIASLEKSVQSMDALAAERESLADEVEKSKAKNEQLVKKIERFQKASEDLQGQYHHKLEEEGRKWQIQHDQSEDAKAQLMSSQRSNFALRGELNNKTQKIRLLEIQLHTAQMPNQVSTASTFVQTLVDYDTSTKGVGGKENAEAPNIYQPSAPVLSAIDHTMNKTI